MRGRGVVTLLVFLLLVAGALLFTAIDRLDGGPSAGEATCSAS